MLPVFDPYGNLPAGIHACTVWPFLQVIVAADEADFESWATGLFVTDRENCPKGVVEVIL